MGDVKEEGDLPDCRWTCPNGVNWDEEPVIRSVRSLETNVDKIEEFHRCSVMSIAGLASMKREMETVISEEKDGSKYT